MTNTVLSPTPIATAASDLDSSNVAHRTGARAAQLEWCLRIGAAGCFIGHGAFGIITKAAWLPYFKVVGIQPDLAYRIMPVVGAVDILAGISMLVAPQPIVLLYMAVWAMWTALLRPLSGESSFETIERAGNYGVPLALLLTMGRPRTISAWFRRRASDALRSPRERIMTVLHWSTVALLFGHGALMAVTGKPVFATHFAAIGVSSTLIPFVGCAEMAAALFVLLEPSPRVLVAIATWKIATEALFPISGASMWELVERAGSYTAPLALAMLMWTQSSSHFTAKRSRVS